MVNNNYEQLHISLEESSEQQRKMTLVFRAYDDGIAFRYEIPKQEGFDSLKIINKNSQFNLMGDHTC